MTPTGYSSTVLRDEPRPGARYISGLTIYDEAGPRTLDPALLGRQRAIEPSATSDRSASGWTSRCMPSS